jgi:hypothetical protein
LIAGAGVVASVAVLVVGVVAAAGIAVLVTGGVAAAGVATLLAGIAIFSVAACAGRVINAQGIRHKVEKIRFLRDVLRILSISNNVSLGGKNNFVVLEINTSTADILDCIQHTPIYKIISF